MRRTEEHFHTPAQVRHALQEAFAIVEEMELDDELRPLAFAKAMELLAGKQVFFEQPQTIPFDGRLLKAR